MQLLACLGAFLSSQPPPQMNVIRIGIAVMWCSSVQVQALGNVLCRAAIMRKPAPRPPGQVTALLHPDVSDALRTAALLGAWVSDGVRWTVGAVDRQNATGTQDDLKVGRISGVLAWLGRSSSSSGLEFIYSPASPCGHLSG